MLRDRRTAVMDRACNTASESFEQQQRAMRIPAIAERMTLLFEISQAEKLPPPESRRHCVAVIRVRDGQRFPSVLSAALAEDTPPQNIRRAIRSGGTAVGSRWKEA